MALRISHVQVIIGLSFHSSFCLCNSGVYLDVYIWCAELSIDIPSHICHISACKKQCHIPKRSSMPESHFLRKTNLGMERTVIS
jgi:hypothetical protein